MADKKISDFTEATSLDASDWLEIENAAGNSRKIKGALVGAGGAIHLYEERATGSDGGASIANVWVARLLNTTKLNTITGASRLSSTVTVTIASPGVFTWNSNNLVNGETISFTTTGALPTGLAINTTYYVVSAAANTFSVSATQGGAAINTTGSQSGTHTAHTSGIELTAGTYDVQARVPCYAAGSSTGYKSRLYDKTNAATLIDGSTIWTSGSVEQENHIMGRFTLSGTATIRLETIATAARTSGLGVNAGITGVNNHFSDIFISRVG